MAAIKDNELSWELMNGSSDWDALIAFDHQCYPKELRVDVQWYRDYYRKGYISWLLLEEDKVRGNFQLRPYDDGGFYISGIAVLPSYQGRGLGRLLLDKLLELYGNHQLIARIQEENFRSRNLFESAGFQWTHETVDETGKWNWMRLLPEIKPKN